MKSFSRSGYRLGNSSAEVKWVYTFFLIFLIIGFATVGGYEFRQIGFHPQAVAEHYRGSSDGELAFPKSFQSLLETTHFHAFIMGIIYLTLAHLFIATGMTRSVKMSIVTIGFLCTLSDLVLPWAVRYLSPHFASGLIVAWMGEWGSYMTMILASLYELWMRPRPSLDELDASS